MNPVLWLVFLFTLFLLGWDWLVKRRRRAQRPETTEADFLRAIRGPMETARDSQILEARQHIAREMGLSPSTIAHDDSLDELRDRYSAVISGDLALGDLMDDLVDARGKDAPPLAEAPKTVRDYHLALLHPDRGSFNLGSGAAWNRRPGDVALT